MPLVFLALQQSAYLFAGDEQQGESVSDSASCNQDTHIDDLPWFGC